MAIARFIKPWTLKRDKKRRRLAELRQRDGDNCRRCRRPMRFDLPPGHDQAPTLEPVGPRSKDAGGGLDTLCLCHVRCNGATLDNTAQVQERLRRRAEEVAEESVPEEAAAPKRRVAGRR
ncbi:hypothetical protein [Sphingomonas sp.]|uniref:hypothetical protein n=1 Tax=Sphingomonas sp. TaxID=28214 RepID=UPI0017F00A17|nr:hypothetical protein [Sphingomonas sp.]MBA3511085.1 hypothetical protein [Sphingomonas sp.]